MRIVGIERVGLLHASDIVASAPLTQVDVRPGYENFFVFRIETKRGCVVGPRVIEALRPVIAATSDEVELGLRGVTEALRLELLGARLDDREGRNLKLRHRAFCRKGGRRDCRKDKQGDHALHREGSAIR
jgi:hypothetical protein